MSIVVFTNHRPCPPPSPSNFDFAALGFAFSWLELVSHRMFMPKLLLTKHQDGWPHVQRLLVSTLKFLEPSLRTAQLTESVRMFYKGMHNPSPPALCYNSVFYKTLLCGLQTNNVYSVLSNTQYTTHAHLGPPQREGSKWLHNRCLFGVSTKGSDRNG